MQILDIGFEFRGKTYELTAKFKDNITLSKSEENLDVWIMDRDYPDDNRWGLYFEGVKLGVNWKYDIEVVLYKDEETGEKLLQVDYIIIWRNDGEYNPMEDAIDPSYQEVSYKYQPQTT